MLVSISPNNPNMPSFRVVPISNVLSENSYHYSYKNINVKNSKTNVISHANNFQ